MPIAIVGAAGLFPGASDLDGFWRLICDARSASAPIPPERADVPVSDLLTDEHGVPDRMVSPRACLLPDFNIVDLDDRVREAGLEPERLGRLDPLVALVLRVGADAWDSMAGTPPDPLRTGVILANIALPTDGSSRLSRSVLGRPFEERVLGADAPAAWDDGLGAEPLDRFVTALPAALLARILGLGGASYTLDAACASSLYALHLACEELRAGRLDAVLAGGASRPDCLYTQIGFSQLRALSPSGVCSPFDTRADGLVVGEGAGVFVLKRLDRALTDGDRIRAVLRGAGVSNDVGGSLLSPESEGQQRAMRAAYMGLDIEPSALDLVECHGTGTRRGDGVELRSLAELLDGSEAVIGSVKSNVGHLLTGAGAAGLMKVLLALEHGVLPPSAGFDEKTAHPELTGTGMRVLDRPETWNPRAPGVPRTAAVSAFGFGGINAHLVVQEYLGQNDPVVCVVPPPDPIAIVGMAARVGGLEDLATVREAGLRGEPVLDARPEHRWGGLEESGWLRGLLGAAAAAMPGAWIERLQLPIGRFRLPPAEMRSVLPQHLLMLQTVDAAVRDAGEAWPADPGGGRLDVGCLVGLGLDPGTTDFHVGWMLRAHARAWADQLGLVLNAAEEQAWFEALREALGPALDAPRVQGALGGMIASRIARELRLGGPCYAVSDEDGSGLRALAAGVRMLQRGEVRTTVVGAVDLAGDLRAVLAEDALRPWSRSGRARPFDARADGAVPGEGAAAVVLKRLSDARADGDTIHAVVAGVGEASGGGVASLDVDAYRRAVTEAWAESGLPRKQAGLVEANAAGRPEGDRREFQALAELWSGDHPRTAVGASKGVYGDTGAVAGLLATVRAASALSGRVLPSAAGFVTPGETAPEGHALHFPRCPAPWHHDRRDGPRTAGVSGVSIGGNCVHVVLREAESSEVRRSLDRPLGPATSLLLLLPADDSGALQRAGLEVVRRLDAGETPVAIAADLARRPRRGPVRAVVADSERELRARLRGLTPPPPEVSGLLSRGELAWVFPGSGNHFVGMGQDLAAAFPGVLRGLDAETELLRSQLMPEWYGPWRAEWSPGWEHEAEAALMQDPRRMIFGQVAHGVTVARVLEAFGLRPRAAIGYSLGESAALFATRAWRARDVMFGRTMESELFTTQLSGPNTIAASAWGSSDWWPAVLPRSAEDVGAVLADLGGDEATTARLLIVNAPEECVLGGLRQDVERVAVRLGVKPRPLEGVPTVHCSVMAPVAEAYRALHVLPTEAPDGVRFYSGCWSRPFAVDSDAVADSIVANALHGLDYPRTIERAWDDGVRVFLEAGPQGSCTRMIGAILEGRPHLAVSACRKGRTGVRNLLEAVGACAESGADVDLSPLYGDERIPEAEPTRLVSVPLGHPRSEPPRPPRPARRPAAVSVPAVSVPVASVPSPPVAAISPVAPPSVPLLRAPVGLPEPSAGMVGLQATASAHELFLQLADRARESRVATLTFHQKLLEAALHGRATLPVAWPAPVSVPVGNAPATVSSPDGVPRSLSREQCMAFAVGRLADVLGPRYAEADAFPTRVRLPDEPLMFVDRVTLIEGEPMSLGAGRCVTEHDVLPDAWYLDGGRVPVCVSVEAGQADLFLSAYLGIDLETEGLRVYRLLDAQVVFHRDLPAAGDVIRYDIHIDRFIRQGSTWLFFFRFEGYIGDDHLISMRDGCAGFFTGEQLAAGRGIVDPSANPPEQRRTDVSGRPTESFTELVSPPTVGTLDDAAVHALRTGDLEAAFGPVFAGRRLHRGLRLPGGRMTLIHRVVEMDPTGGAFGLGTVSTAWDVDPKGWYLTCHFVDDQVMPGTFMYEGCLHTLRVLLLRMGWTAEESDRDLHYAPIPGIPSRLRCRGQVTEHTRTLTYRLDIKEIGYDPEPYVLADALMYGDGRCIVQFENVSYRLSGLSQADIERTWGGSTEARESQPRSALPVDASGFGPPRAGKPIRYDAASVLAFAVGNPSEAFGEPYLPFDSDRRIARLPGPPFCFLDRVTELEPMPWVLEPGGWVEAEYDVPADAWYFAANRQRSMPFAVILETALQPCGWLAAYLGSALRSEQDLHFRNLSGTATLHGELFPDIGTVTTRVRLTSFSEAASMIIQEFDFQLWAGGRILYDGVTRFGFFPTKSLEDQVGVRGAAARAWQPDVSVDSVPFPTPNPQRPVDVPQGAEAPGRGLHLPARAIGMLDRVEYHPAGGPAGLGWIRGSKAVDAEDWFFEAHFHQDPVIPGSLGLEAFLQLLKVVARERWPEKVDTHRFEPIAVGREHKWLYRGQVVPKNAEESVEASIESVEDGSSPMLVASGFLRVDGRIIYEMISFGLRLVPGDAS